MDWWIWRVFSDPVTFIRRAHFVTTFAEQSCSTVWRSLPNISYECHFHVQWPFTTCTMSGPHLRDDLCRIFSAYSEPILHWLQILTQPKLAYYSDESNHLYNNILSKYIYISTWAHSFLTLYKTSDIPDKTKNDGKYVIVYIHQNNIPWRLLWVCR